MTRDHERTRSVYGHSYEVSVPASTSNLGAGYDCFGLALGLYLSVRATVVSDRGDTLAIRTRGEGVDEVDNAIASDNLIFRAMRFAADREGWNLPSIRIAVHNDIPIGRGLGSSAAAIVAGIKLASLLCYNAITDDTLLRYAQEIEGHADNIAAAVHGGFVVTCVETGGEVVAIKRHWPAEIKVMVVSPDTPVKTSLARSVLPSRVEHADAVHNLQRAALFGAAIEAGRLDMLWNAMQDRIHQVYRQTLAPGIAEALATPKQPGLLGVALSGSGPSVVAFVNDRFEEIGETIASQFRSHGAEAKVRLLEVDDVGLRTSIEAA